MSHYEDFFLVRERKLPWSLEETLEWALNTRSPKEKNKNQNPTIEDLIRREEEIIKQQIESKDSNAGTHLAVLNILKTYPDTSRSAHEVLEEKKQKR